MKLLLIACLGLISVMAAACGGEEESTRQTPTATAAPTATQPQPTPIPTDAVAGHSVSGFVLDSSVSLLLGGLVTLDPSGKSAVTDSNGSYQITGVDDGFYEVFITPRCVAYGCYPPQLLQVAGGDVLEFNLAPFPALVLPGGPAAARFLSDGSGRSLTLDQIELAQDYLVLISPNDMQPGESVQMVLAGPECLRCAALLAMDAPVAWSVEPEEGASIDAESGLLTVNAATATGASFTVTADAGDGRYSVSKEVSVYSAAENPLVGVWTETHTGNINQLLLTSGGEFAVTMNPYEHYQDYWGTYIFDQETGVMELTVAGKNQAAPEFSGTGSFAIDASGVLSLESICLGGWDENIQSPAMNCGHEFER